MYVARVPNVRLFAYVFIPPNHHRPASYTHTYTFLFIVNCVRTFPPYILLYMCTSVDF